jgi:hypothetical protein
MSELFQLYHAYLKRASGERVSFERQSSRHAQRFWIRVDYYPDRGPRGIRGKRRRPPMSTTSNASSSGWRAQHRLRIVTDSVGLPIFYFDRALRLRFYNKPWKISALADDLLGQPLKNFVSPR